MASSGLAIEMTIAFGQYCWMAVGHRVGDLQVGRQQFFPAGESAVGTDSARDAGGVDDQVGVLEDVVVLAALESDITADDGRGFGDVEALALGDVRALDVHQGNRPGQLALKDLLCQHATDVPAADKANLVEH